ncbi:MAG TPA: hypothetical protein VIV12_08785, partial [Streptosporangiaceae bacterium]
EDAVSVFESEDRRCFRRDERRWRRLRMGNVGGRCCGDQRAVAAQLARYAEDRFEVRVAGELNGFAGTLPAGARAEADGRSTRITLPGTDTRALYEFLDHLRAGQVPLLSVSQAQPGLEDIFLKLIGEPDSATRSGAERAS